jgi:hypothetical protein
MSPRRGERSRERTAKQADSELSAADPVPRRLLNVDQAAAYMNVSGWTIRQWLAAGSLPSISLPPVPPREGDRAAIKFDRTLVDREDLDRLIEACKG